MVIKVNGLWGYFSLDLDLATVGVPSKQIGPFQPSADDPRPEKEQRRARNFQARSLLLETWYGPHYARHLQSRD
jgi:hypothetical protein